MRDGRGFYDRGHWTWSWTSWTFGVWWYTTKLKKIKLFGMDLGPLSYVRRWKK